MHKTAFILHIPTKKLIDEASMSSFCGATRNRTGDTRIFSPLLYQLSYGTKMRNEAFVSLLRLQRYTIIHNPATFSSKIFASFHKKPAPKAKKCTFYFHIYQKPLTFALTNRIVAQLVAHYVRDVGVGRSSRLYPTHNSQK